MATKDKDDLGDALEGARKLEALLKKLDDNLSITDHEVLIFDMSPLGQERAVLMHDANQVLLAQWRREGSTLKFVGVNDTEAKPLATESVDDAYKHTVAYLNDVRRRNARKPAQRSG